MADGANALGPILDELLGPEPPTRPAHPLAVAAPARPEPAELGELMEWVSEEVFGEAA